MVIDLLTKRFIQEEHIDVLQNNDFVLEYFDDRSINFLHKLSRGILKNPVLKSTPDMVALAFWLRKSNLLRIKNENDFYSGRKIVLSPRGVVFHVCPSNVDTMFLYSMALSLVVGNKNIVRISQRTEDPRIYILIDIINSIITEEKLFNNYLSFVQYGHEEVINKYYSIISDARILWGGDQTVNLFKSIPTKAWCKDISFPDRVSLAIIDIDEFEKLDSNEKKELARNFYNDSYTFDQKGCSTPQAIFTIGNKQNYDLFKNEFYDLLVVFSEENFDTDIFSLASLKFNQLANDAIAGTIVNTKRDSNYTIFTELVQQSALDVKCGGGYFQLKHLDDIYQILNYISRKTQTISYFGLDDDEKKLLLRKSVGKGIERIVPIGEALTFNYLWDGYNIIEELTQKKVFI